MTAAKRLVPVLLVVFVLLALPQLARAKTIKVGNGTPASCTEFALRSALIFAVGAPGSAIQFNCGIGPVTIAVAATLTVPDNTTIHGGGMITLDGQFPLGTSGPILRVDRESTVTLKSLTIQRGVGCFFCQASNGGGIHNEGTLTVRGCTFSGNSATIFGGGIYNEGTLTVYHSTFSGNHATSAGGAIFSQGALAVHGSSFTGNGGTLGAAISAEGTLTVQDSAFYRNGSRGATFEGGALEVGRGTHTISNSSITQNSADENSGAFAVVGGALTVTDSIISENAGTFGGAIDVRFGGTAFDVPGSLTIKNSRISGNQGVQGGGILNESTLLIQDSIITGNVGSDGGGIYNAGTLTVKGSTVTKNVAEGSFGFGGGILNLGGLVVQDSTITENVAGADSGGIFNGGGIFVNFGTLKIKGDTVVTNNTPDDIAP